MRPMKLNMLPFEADDLIRIQCEGPLSLAGLPHGTDPLVQILGPLAFSRKVLLDLKLTEGTDTSGVAWLLRTTERFAQAGGRLILLSVPPMVEQIVLVLGLGTHFDAARTEAEGKKFVIREALPPEPPAADREPPVVAGRVGATGQNSSQV